MASTAKISMLYDLVLNTERISIETCARLVCDLVESTEFRETEASRTILNDKTLEAHVRLRLRERFTVGMGASGADATVHAGKIVLTGTAIHSALVEDASKLAGAIAGVKAVENQMVVVRGPRVIDRRPRRIREIDRKKARITACGDFGALHGPPGSRSTPDTASPACPVDRCRAATTHRAPRS